MFVRMVYESFRRQKRRKLLAGIAVTLGVTVATAMIAVATDIGDKINRELRSYGANLLVTPQEDTLDVEIGGVSLKPPSDGAFLNEAELPKIKGMFWRNNIVGFAPMLPANVNVRTANDSKPVTLLGTYFSKQLRFGKEDFVTGVRITHPWWKVQGAWPDDNSNDILLGERLAAKLDLKPGDHLHLVGGERRVTGILSTGSSEDENIVAPLALAQEILGRPGAVRRIYVSALTFAEAMLLALLGGAVGFVCGTLLARQIGRSIFDSQITIQPVLFPVILGIAVFVTFAGSAAAIRRAVRFDPVFALRGEA